MLAEDKKRAFQAQISKSINVLGEKNSSMTVLDVMAAENMLIYAECVVSCLRSFIQMDKDEK